VNRAFFAAAMPLLWQRPTGRALDPKALTSPARRAMYAASIRNVHLVQWRSPLWQATIGRGVTGTANSSDGGVHTGSHAQSSLHLPRLRELQVCIWDFQEYRYSLVGKPAEHAMAPLLRYVSSDLEALACPLTANLMDHLEAHHTQQLFLQTAETGRETTHNEQQLVPMRLQRLSLFRSSTEHDVALPSAVERLLAWLSHSPFAAPRLRSVELWCDNDVLEQQLVDCAFCLLALHEGLERLSLSRGCQEVSLSAVKHVIALGHCPTEQGNDVEGADTGRELCPPKRSPRHSRRPFARLKHLAIRIESSSASQLVSLLPSLLSLHILMSNVELEHKGEEETKQILLPLYGMTQLHELYLRLIGGYVRVSEHALRTLGLLQQLRVLELHSGYAKYLEEADMGRMLRPLRHLCKVGISMGVSNALHHKLLRVLGESCPQLRQLEIFEDISLEHQLKGALHVPTFPCLEYLGIRALKVGKIGKLR
jgi:hypothetical protein